MNESLNEPVLVRFPSSHRGRNNVSGCLGYNPHFWHSFRKEGSFTYLPPEDAKKLLESKLVTSTRIDKSTLHSCWNQPNPFRGLPAKDEICKHDLARRTFAPQERKGAETYSYCCECGKYFPLTS